MVHQSMCYINLPIRKFWKDITLGTFALGWYIFKLPGHLYITYVYTSQPYHSYNTIATSTSKLSTGVIYVIYTQQVDIKPQGLYKTYNDIHNRLYQSEHAQSSCKLKNRKRSWSRRVVYKWKKEEKMCRWPQESSLK